MSKITKHPAIRPHGPRAHRHRALGLGRQALQRASKEGFVDFARQCHAIGYKAFKIHGWNDGNAREEADNVLHMAREMGDRMTLVRGVEPKADFVIAGGTDFLRVDPEYDMGITGALKIAHLAESLGLDVEIHACGPAHRHLMSALRNSNYYEVALLGPDCPNAVPPVYTCGYTDQIDCVDSDGTVPVPTGPGLGVSYDWDFIHRNRLAHHVFE